MQLYEMVNGPPLPRRPVHQTARSWEDASDTPTDTLVIESGFRPTTQVHGGGLEAGKICVRELDYQALDPIKVQAVQDLVEARQKQLVGQFQALSRSEIEPAADSVIDKSRAAIQVAKNRLMVALYEFVRVSETEKAAINYVTSQKDAINN
jgi:hypothetical protein